MGNKKLKVIGFQGVNASGKSTLAHLIARDYPDYDTVATDNLLAIARMINPDDKRLHHSSYSSWERFGSPTEENIRKGFFEYREATQPFLKCILDRARDQKVGMIIEGVHINPEMLKQYRGNLEIYNFMLKISDEGTHRERIDQKCDYRPELLKRFNNYFPRIRDIQLLLIKEAERYNLPIIETGTSQEESLAQIRSFLK